MYIFVVFVPRKYENTKRYNFHIYKRGFITYNILYVNVGVNETKRDRADNYTYRNSLNTTWYCDLRWLMNYSSLLQCI